MNIPRHNVSLDNECTFLWKRMVIDNRAHYYFVQRTANVIDVWLFSFIMKVINRSAVNKRFMSIMAIAAVPLMDQNINLKIFGYQFP